MAKGKSKRQSLGSRPLTKWTYRKYTDIMTSLGTIVKFGYGLVVVSMLLMLWASLVGARDLAPVTYPPCFFNPLCSCSKAVPDLGIVRCHNVPLPRLPPPLNTSKVFMLHMEKNGLRSLEPHFFQGTGLYRLSISHNPLEEIPDEAFMGLEHSLWELKLQDDQLTMFPSRALRHLQKLKILDLAENEITDIYPESWRGLESSLQTLILANNRISTLPSDAFTSLALLDTLDIRGNAIMELDVDTFRSGLPRLRHLYLGDNQLSNIPYQQLVKLRLLRTLDLSYNRITMLRGAASEPDAPMALDTLRLDYNQIQYLPPGAFQNFEILNRTYLDGNPISVIQSDAFRDARMRELSLRDCGISDLAQGAFAGLEPSLQFLDLGGNNLTDLPDSVLTEYDFLRNLIISDNNIPNVYQSQGNNAHHGQDSQSTINGFQYSLYQVDLGGKTMGASALQDIRRMRNLRSLSMSKLPKNELAPDDFVEFGVDLEELRISSGNLQTIRNHAFKHVRGLKRLNLADNSISSIEPEAFTEVGHSLVWLSMAHGLAPSLSSVFGDALKQLTILQTLDLSNNRLHFMPETSFHFLRKLRVLQLEDNQIDQLHKGTFQSSIHRDLEEIYFSYNNIEKIDTETFVELTSLQRIHLDDNRIKHIDRHAFISMDRLKQVTLRGNRIQTISPEAFQNLPELVNLDLAYNKLTGLDLSIMDQVGSITTLRLNVSHNEIKHLAVNITGREVMGNLALHVKVLDLSFNNISKISKSYFNPLESSLTHIYLRNNVMQNATKDVFGNMPHLQWLDLTDNDLDEMDFDAFRNTKSLQVLLLSGNNLAELPAELLQGLSKLRVVHLDRNKLRMLPDSFLNEEGLERLDISHNLFSRMPITSIGPAASATLVELDLSHNFIASLHGPDAFARFRSLIRLDISYNRLVRLEDAMFSKLPRLSSLDLSHNIELMLESRGRTFHGLEDTLFELNLQNTSLNIVPDLPLNKLRSLNLADNMIAQAPFEMAANLSLLRRLDMGNNRLELVPPLARLLPQLRELILGGNLITTLSNSSFSPAAERLQELDLQHLPLTFFENGALSKMRSLRAFHVSPYPDIYDFNLPRVLQFNTGLRHLHIQVEEKEELTEGMLSGDLPTKVKNFTVTGQAMKSLPYNLLQGIRSPQLHLIIYNTSLETVPRSIFQLARRVRNITLDLRNNTFRTLGNPNTGNMPGLPRSMFLEQIQLTGNRWTCDCELGWVEMWNRKKRQYLCPENNDECQGDDDDLRTAECFNKNNMSLLQVFKSEIECGWGSGGHKINGHFIPVVLTGLALSALCNAVF